MQSISHKTIHTMPITMQTKITYTKFPTKIIGQNHKGQYQHMTLVPNEPITVDKITECSTPGRFNFEVNGFYFPALLTSDFSFYDVNEEITL